MILELILFIISMCSSVYADGLNDAITMAPIKSVEDSRLTTSIDRIPVSRVDSRFGNLFIRSSGFSLPMMIDPPCPRLASTTVFFNIHYSGSFFIYDEYVWAI